MQKNGFNHSIKVPRLYKIAAKIVQQVREEGASIKHLVYQAKHPNYPAILALVTQTLQNGKHLDYILRKSKILMNETRFDPWLARILITELLWGKKRLAGDAKPIQTILSYETKLKSILDKLIESKEIIKPKKVTKPRYVRINTLVMTVADAINGFRDEGWIFVRNNHTVYEEFLQMIRSLEENQFTIDLHVPDLLVFPQGTNFYTHSCYQDGSIILQDKASCIPALLLNPTPNSVVLDMCAAPGMKTSQLAAAMNNEGLIYAVEKDQRRFQNLTQIMETVGATCVKTVNRDVLTLSDKEFPDVEYILLDPSCSGSGMTDRLMYDDNTDEQRNAERLEKLAGFQKKIIYHALKNFPKVKRIVYSTCSIYAEENEMIVKKVMENCKNFKLKNARKQLKMKWINSISQENGEEYKKILKRCIYAKPEVDLTNGFFVAVFERIISKEEDENNTMKCET